MPYTIRHNSSTGKYEVVKKDTGKVAAKSDTLAGARGYIYHAEHADLVKPKKESKKSK